MCGNCQVKEYKTPPPPSLGSLPPSKHQPPFYAWELSGEGIQNTPCPLPPSHLPTISPLFMRGNCQVKEYKTPPPPSLPPTKPFFTCRNCQVKEYKTPPPPSLPPTFQTSAPFLCVGIVRWRNTKHPHPLPPSHIPNISPLFMRWNCQVKKYKTPPPPSLPPTFQTSAPFLMCGNYQLWPYWRNWGDPKHPPPLPSPPLIPNINPFIWVNSNPKDSPSPHSLPPSPNIYPLFYVWELSAVAVLEEL